MPLVTLDEWFSHINGCNGPILIKLVIQGFELEVIEGGLTTLRKASWVVLEVSFHELYIGQPLFAEVHNRMTNLGFRYRGNIEQFLNRDRSQVLFADAMFERVG